MAEDDGVGAAGAGSIGADSGVAPGCGGTNPNASHGEAGAVAEFVGTGEARSARLLAPGDNSADPIGEFSSVAVSITVEEPGAGIVCGCNTVDGKITGGESDKGRILFTLESELSHDEGGKRRTLALYRTPVEDDSCAKGKIFSSKMTS
jgi:hypothetical protein